MNLLNLTDAQGVILQKLVFCGLAIVLVMVASVAMIAHITVDHELFTAATTFDCIIGGVAGGSFLAQRLTDWKYTSLKGEAAAKVAEATRPSAVSVTTPATTVNTPPTGD